MPETAAKKGEKRKMRQSLVSELDLTKIQGKGDFPCPKCGVIISPEDETGTTYAIQEVKMKKDDQLEELIIRCNNCESIVHITGFTSL